MPETKRTDVNVPLPIRANLDEYQAAYKIANGSHISIENVILKAVKFGLIRLQREADELRAKHINSLTQKAKSNE